MKLVATKEMTFSSGRHHVIQTSQIPAYFDKGKPKERRILIMMQSKHSNSMGKVQKVFILCVGRSGIKISMHIFRGCVGVGIFSVTRRSRSDSRQLLTYSLTHSLSDR